MLKKRLIARLDIQGDKLIKTVNLEGRRYVGDPQEFLTRYDQEGIDEIIYLDVVASLYRRNSLAGLLRRATESCFVPVCAGGGVASIEDARALLEAGADKIAVNSAAVARPDLINELANKFGSQCVVVQIDGKWKDGKFMSFVDGGREPSFMPVVRWGKEVVDRGAGEILFTSIDREGTAGGCDLDSIQDLAAVISTPLVAAGGVGSIQHIIEAFDAGADGVAMAKVLHYQDFTLAEARAGLTAAGVAVR